MIAKQYISLKLRLGMTRLNQLNLASSKGIVTCTGLDLAIYIHTACMIQAREGGG